MNDLESTKHRLLLLEQRMDVQAGEISQLATEIQKAMEGFSQGTSMALQVLAERLKLLEDWRGTAVPLTQEVIREAPESK